MGTSLLFAQAEAVSHYFAGARFDGAGQIRFGKGIAMKSLYLLLGSDPALAERALSKIVAELKE